MVFSSVPFLFFFFPIFFIIYRLVPRNKNLIILIFSLLFYAWGEPVYVFLMIAETLSDYLIGRKLEKTEGPVKRKVLLICSLVIDLGILGFFKYADFLINSINYALSSKIPNLNLALPIGISFFTFQSLSYVVDLYKGKIRAEHNYLNYLTYISMFPQLIAGPIVRFSTISEELGKNRHEKEIFSEAFATGFMRFLKGLFKKVLIANQIGALFTQIDSLTAGSASVLSMWLGAVAFTFQIYFDFSGYSDMAIGMGKMMGFTFEENFRHPLVSDSITDFWKKWHISLSVWFRDYVYIPLGGNRVGKFKHIRNIMIVWMLTGLWHGASWNFVIWGLYFGILLLIEKLLLGKILDKLPLFARRLYSFIIVCIGFVIFSHDTMDSLILYLKGLIGLHGNSFCSPDFIWYLKDNLVIILVSIIFSMPLSEMLPKAFDKYKEKLAVPKAVIYLFLFALSVAFIVNDSYNPFLYFRF